MFNKRGTKAYTLIELMAATLILGVVATVTIVSVNYIIKSSKGKIYKEQITRIEAGVKDWSINNTNSLPNNSGKIVFFSIDKLLSEGVIDTETINDPRNNEILDGCIVIYFDDANNQYNYEYIDLDCNELANTYKPVITVNGSTNQYAEVNDVNYQIPSATAISYSNKPLTVSGPIIKKDGNTLTNIDLSEVGSVYTLVYMVTDPISELSSEEVVTLTVRDTIPPVLEIEGNSVAYTINHEANPNFINPIITVKDNSCGIDGDNTLVNNCNITLTPTITGSINPQLPGTYNLTYRAIDSSNNVKFFVVTVNVDDTISPSVPSYTAKTETSNGSIYNGEATWTKENVWIGNLLSIDLGTGIKLYEFAIGCIGSYTELTPNGTNNYTISVPHGSSYDGSICFRAKDNKSTPNIGDPVTIPIKIDKISPTVNFTNDGTVNHVKSANTTVTVTDFHSGVISETLKYQWTTSPAAPADSSFVETFTNGGVINSPVGVSGLYYLWIYAADDALNITKTSSSIFKLDNQVPAITLNGVNPYEMVVGDSFIEPGLSVLDNSGLVPVVTTSVIPTNPGTHTIIYTATDEAGNIATATRTLYIWSLWSNWSTTIETNTATKQVASKIEYRYRDYVLIETIYSSCQDAVCGIESQIYDWNEWSAWQDQSITPLATREVQTQTVYRFRTR